MTISERDRLRIESLAIGDFKTDWTAEDIVLPEDINRQEGNSKSINASLADIANTNLSGQIAGKFNATKLAMKTVASGIDLDTLLEPGIYYIQGTNPNTPYASWGSMYVTNTGTNNVQQLFISNNTGRMFKRYSTGAVLQPWKEMWDAGNLSVERGTWTPVAPAGYTLTNTSSIYDVTGKMCLIVANWVLSSYTGSDSSAIFSVTGLPFSCRASYVSLSISYNVLQTKINANSMQTMITSNTIRLLKNGLYVTNGELASITSSQIVFSGVYPIA